MEFEYQDKKYKVGDNIVVYHKPGFLNSEYQEALGTINFREYEDCEQYADGSHLGIVVDFSYFDNGKLHSSRITFPDAISGNEYYLKLKEK